MTTEQPYTGHPTRLTPTLGLRSVVLFGLAYMTPIIVLGIFGVIAEASQGASAGSYLVATVAMLFTAASYAKMARHYPVAGSSYTYVRRALDPRAGFMVGWIILLDYLFLPLVIWLIGAAYLTGAFPLVPTWVWIIIFIVATTALNIIGLKVADKANFVLMAMQFLVLALFVVFAFIYIVSEQGAGALLSTNPFVGEGSFSVVASGAAIAAYSFLGFDAVSTLTEDTINPQRNIPRAIMLIAFIGGFVFITVAYALTLVEPGSNFDNADSLAADTALTIGGSLFAAVFITGLIIGQFTSGLAAQASVSRLLFAMGRDGVLPKGFFGRLSDRFATPVLNIVLCGIIGLGALFLDVATSTSFINFGAFTAFTLVNLSVIGYFIRHRNTEAGFRLNPTTYVIAPLIGAIVDVYLLTKLDSTALILGVIWLSIGAVYLLILTHGLRDTPPEMTLAE